MTDGREKFRLNIVGVDGNLLGGAEAPVGAVSAPPTTW
jgi:hypothetical protein